MRPSKRKRCHACQSSLAQKTDAILLKPTGSRRAPDTRVSLVEERVSFSNGHFLHFSEEFLTHVS